ncbi:hypothetical protein AD998_03195 [bacterium 336/3]|nr:hypothetical protein AD998_03195 [bacterium 336/3]
METFNSFQEEKNKKEELATESKWIHKVMEEEKTWTLDEPSILFTANIMDKIKTKQRPVFHKGIIWLFGGVWAVIFVVAIGQAIPKLKPISWELPSLNFSKLSEFFSFEVNASLLMLANMIIAVWVFFIIQRFLQSRSDKKISKA